MFVPELIDKKSYTLGILLVVEVTFCTVVKLSVRAVSHNIMPEEWYGHLTSYGV